MKKTSTILAIGSALAMGSAQAEIESSFHVGYSTDYIWRGLDQNGTGSDGLYEYGIDFTGETHCGITWNAGIWRADHGETNDFTNGYTEETDYYASLSKTVGAFDLSFGVIRYDYGPINDVNFTELTLGASTEVAGLDVSAGLFYVVAADDEVGDIYSEGALWGEISVGKSFDIGGGATLDVAANYGTTLEDQGGPSYRTYGLTAAVSQEIGENLTGSVYVAGEKTKGRGADAKDNVFGGISLAYGF